MATKQQRCRWCGLLSIVPLEAQNLSCPSCYRVTPVQGNYYNRMPAGINHRPPNGFVPNPGYVPAPSGRPQRLMNVVNRYLASKQPQPQPQPQLQPQLQPQRQPQLQPQRQPQRPTSPGYNYQVPPQLRPSSAHGQKRALLCGINYKGNKHSLDGSINDVFLMKNLLVRKFGFPNSSVVLLTEEEDYTRFPTKRNIRSAMRWLVHGCQPGDSLVFHYSGHGAQVRDVDGDELDGLDESLMPVDYETEGRILDDEMNATIVRPLPQGVTLHAIIDTCFSGTFLDLSNVCRLNRQGLYKWEDHHISHAAYRGTNGGVAISISACDDHQNSGDTTAFSGEAAGALTYSFVQTLEQEPRLSYGRLLMIMRKRIDAARDQAGVNGDTSQSSQEPQLSSSYKFDIYSKPFTM